jgi:hypothetical protein
VLIVVLKALALLWFVVGSLLSYRALRDLFDPDLQPARDAWRRQEFGEREAQRRADFYMTNLAFLRTFITVMALWPVIWGSVLWDRWREIRRNSE